MKVISGRHVFITSAAQGIGLGIAEAFARAGARLTLTDVDEEALDASVDWVGHIVTTDVLAPADGFTGAMRIAPTRTRRC